MLTEKRYRNCSTCDHWRKTNDPEFLKMLGLAEDWGKCEAEHPNALANTDQYFTSDRAKIIPFYTVKLLYTEDKYLCPFFREKT